MLGNKRIPLCSNNIIRKEFSVEKDESSEWFDLHEEFKQNYSVLDIFTVLILTNCNTNCSTTVQYYKNMAYVRKHISLIHLETNSLLNYWFIDIESLFYSHNTPIKKGPRNIKRTLFSSLVLRNVNCYSGAPAEPHTHIGEKRKPMNWFSHGYHG